MSAASDAARVAADHAARETARLQTAYLKAEDVFIAAVAEAQRAGEANWREVYEAYLQVKDWSVSNGITRYSERWQQHIPYNPIQMRQFAEALPDAAEGAWSGSTDWEGLERGGYPPNGVHVAFVLFGNARQPIRYGATSKFWHYTGRMHKGEGLRWSSWRAILARDEDDARAKKHELERLYGRPGEARADAAPVVPETPAPMPSPAGGEAGADQPALASSEADAVDERHHFVRMVGIVYRAPFYPAEFSQCTGLTKAGARCRNTLDDGQAGVFDELPVPGGYVSGYDFGDLNERPSAEVQRWLAQRCRLHVRADPATTPEWTVFDPQRDGDSVQTAHQVRDHFVARYLGEEFR